MVSLERLKFAIVVFGVLAYHSIAVLSQGVNELPNSFPHEYPGRPDGDLNPEWQDYFLVTDPLPNITFPLPRSFAGNIPVQREGHPNDTLFFVGFEKSNGSLTSAAGDNNNEPWAIWLNGGPGTSSLFGLFFQNGPIRLQGDYSAQPNNWTWSQLADYFWVDQPVGVGYSTVEADGYALDQDQMGIDFMGFLGNLVKVFPSLATRPLFLTGESYAGYYIPYIMKAYFQMENPPVRIAKIAIGDGAISDEQVFSLLPSLHVIETFPQIIGYDHEVYQYFKEQTRLCSYDINITYPQTSPLPSIPLVLPTSREIPYYSGSNKMSKRQVLEAIQKRSTERTVELVRDADLGKREVPNFEIEREAWKAERLHGDLAGVLDPWYGCLLLDMYIDFAINFTYPWSMTGGFDVYDVSDVLMPGVVQDASVFLNDPQVRKAFHAPTVKDWAMNFPFTFGDTSGFNHDFSPSPMNFLSNLATNATEHDVGIVLYSGNNDGLIHHFSTELTIQNTTFGGIQGFTQKPSTPWYDDDGEWAGIIHQERNWTYVLFYGAGHLVPSTVPQAAFVFFREFILGSNTTGLLIPPNGVIGGSNTTFANAANIPAADELYLGAGATQTSYVFPEATRQAWRKFISEEKSAKAEIATTGNKDSARGSASEPLVLLGTTLLLVLTMFLS